MAAGWSMKLMIPVVILAALIGGTMAPQHGHAAECDGLGWRDRSGAWTRIQAPITISSFTVDPYDPSLMLVANDATVMRSVNTGCSWDNVFRPDAQREVADIVAAPVRNKSFLYVLLTAPPMTPGTWGSKLAWVARPAPGPEVALSRDRGKTWTRFDEGLPDEGRAVALVVAPSDPRTLYMVVSLGQHVKAAEAGQEASLSLERSALYVTDDAGKTWQAVSDPMFVEPAGVLRLVVDPAESQSLWAATTRGLARSDDGGRTWAIVERVGSEQVDAVDVARHRGEVSRVAAFRGGSMFVSQDGGHRWKKVPSSAFYVVKAAAHVPGSVSPVVAADTQMFRFDMRARRWKDITPRLKAERNGSQDNYYCEFSVTRSRPMALYSCTSTTLLKYGGGH